MFQDWKWTEEDEQNAAKLLQGGEKKDMEQLMQDEEKELNDRYSVPVELEASFTPAEIEEAILLFDELDEISNDTSGNDCVQYCVNYVSKDRGNCCDLECDCD